MTEVKVKQVAGGNRNVTYQIRGILSRDIAEPIEVAKGIKLSSAVWVVQEKMGLYLWWGPGDLIMPMESRNSVRFDTAIAPPDDWDGVLHLTSYNMGEGKKGFLIVLDFDR